MKTKIKSVYLTEKQFDRIAEYAEETGLGESEIIRRAVDLFFEAEEEKEERRKQHKRK